MVSLGSGWAIGLVARQGLGPDHPRHRTRSVNLVRLYEGSPPVKGVTPGLFTDSESR